MAATGLVADVARRLAAHGIPVMPVKGALLQHWLYQDPSDRPLTDVDALVRPAQLEKAVATLLREGYGRAGGSSIGAVVLETPFGLALDLHPRLFDDARYHFPTSELFARSSEDTSIYGVSVRVPSALDAYAHLIGKFGSDHLDQRAIVRLDELARMTTRIKASPKTTARHLVHCGMRRVARYTLPLVHQCCADPFSQQVLEHLPPDAIGAGVAALAGKVIAGRPAESRLAALFAHSLNDSLPRGVYSGSRALLKRSRF
jgi:hypothetical protein